MNYKLFIGTSGYSYPHWRGVFYPENLSEGEWLEYYCRYFSTVELNVTFYRLPNKKTFQSWYERTPKDFKFVVKGSRYITHLKRLKNISGSVKIFFDQISPLEKKLSAILWQLPPRFTADAECLEEFLSKTHNAQLVFGKTRQAFEFRDISWFNEEIYEILKKYNAGIALADHPLEMKIASKYSSSSDISRGEKSEMVLASMSIGARTVIIPPTADFIYVRRHGPASLFSSKYSDRELQNLAENIKIWQKQKKDAYVFYNNDARGYAVDNALTLKKLLKQR